MKMGEYELEHISEMIAKGNITALTFRLNEDEDTFMAELASALTTPENQLKMLVVHGAWDVYGVLPMELLKALRHKNCVMTSFSADFGTFNFTVANQKLILKSKLTSIHCTMYKPKGTEFWAKIMETSGNKLEHLAFRAFGTMPFPTESFMRALSNQHCKLERLVLEDIVLDGFKATAPITHLKELYMKKNGMSTQQWREFALSLPRFESLTSLEITSNLEFTNEPAMLLAAWLENPNCKLRGRVNLMNTSVGTAGARRPIRALCHPNCHVESFDFLSYEEERNFPHKLLKRTRKCMDIARTCLALQSAACIQCLGVNSAMRRLPQALVKSVAKHLV